MIGDRLRRRRQALGLSLQELADQLNQLGIRLSRASLSNYENNKAMPNAKTLWGLAKILESSMDYFVTEKSTKVILQGFRKKAHTSQAKVDQFTAFVLDEVEKRVELDSLLGEADPKDIPDQVTIRSLDEAESIANDLRQKWKLGDQPIASVAALLEARGWYVIDVPNDPDYDGLSGYVASNHRPFAVTRKGIPIDRTRLNLLHEAGHSYVVCDDPKMTEKAAFRFAAALLLPASRVFAELGKKRESIDLNELLTLKKRYGLSMQAIVVRLRDLEVISESYCSLLFRYFNRLNIRVDETGSQDLKFEEEPLAFSAKVHRAYAEGLLSEADALRLLPGFHAETDSTSRLSSTEIKRILALSEEERDKILDASAEASIDIYNNPDVNISGLVDDISEYS
jgi:transcriptional regulator with XRE-family HTH domain